MESIYTSSSIVGVPTILLIPSVQKKLGCRNISAHTFHVQVVNGETLTCTEIYQMVSVEIQGFQFKSHLFAVDIQGSDAILRMQWLRSLGHVTHDWKELTMEFTMVGRSYFICRESLPQLCHSFVHSMQKLLTNGMDSFFMQLVANSTDTAEASLVTKETAELDQFLDQYQSVFQAPTTLPPKRSHDHRISLEPGTNAVNVRPYRYPHIQKKK